MTHGLSKAAWIDIAAAELIRVEPLIDTQLAIDYAEQVLWRLYSHETPQRAVELDRQGYDL